MWRCCGAPSTIRRYDATTSVTCAYASSMLETSFSDEFKAARIGTAIATLGRAIHHPRSAPTRDVQDPV
jgi:hypothetical protein